MSTAWTRLGATALVAVIGLGLAPTAVRAQEKGALTEEERAQMAAIQPEAFEKLTALGREMDNEVLKALQQDEGLYAALLEGQKRYERASEPKERMALLREARSKLADAYMAALEKSGVNLEAWAERMAAEVNAVQAIPVIVRVEQGVFYFEPAKPADPPRTDPPATPAMKPVPATQFFDDPPVVKCGLGAGGRYRITPTSVQTSAISGFLGGCSSTAYKAARPPQRSAPFTISSTADLRIHGTIWGGAGGAGCVATASHSFFQRLSSTPWAAVLFPAWFDEAIVGTTYSLTHQKPTASFYTYTFSLSGLGGADCYAEITNIAASTSS